MTGSRQHPERGEGAFAGDKDVSGGRDGRRQFVDRGRDFQSFVWGDAAIEIKGAVCIPESFNLMIGSEQIDRTCRVVWRKYQRIGVAFI